MKMSIREAINQTLHQEMERDERVIVLGEDVASDQGGVYGITDGLPAKFGLHRVIDTPITESAIVGAAGGAALTGLGRSQNLCLLISWACAWIKFSIRSPSSVICLAVRRAHRW